MRIGNREVLLNQTMFIPDGEVAEIEEMVASTERLRLRIRSTVESPGQKPIIKYEVVEGWFEFKFENFNEAGGAATNSTTVFASTKDGREISYFAAVYRLQNATKIELQIMMGDPS